MEAIRTVIPTTSTGWNMGRARRKAGEVEQPKLESTADNRQQTFIPAANLESCKRSGTGPTQRAGGWTADLASERHAR
ncbi:hypothetical protein NHX12_029915 [Muraenolepis orangiensis]|uniref:Uncharacterized protein n=1 Tax=Muraenolepis orangiensis TaxID=630683 RepID=A0A9Q0IMB4_9TELE|nr:hypothetical protein NHX12_029915 [Muraenolepis orangiensis]